MNRDNIEIKFLIVIVQMFTVFSLIALITVGA